MNDDRPHSDDVAELRELGVIWNTTEPKRFDDERMIRALHAHAAGKTSGLSLGASRVRYRSFWAAGIGAITMVMVFVFAINYVTNISSRNSSTYSRIYTTNVAQSARIRLADGSQVVLAPATTLKIGSSGRNIDLNGEALFTVTSHKESPFIVVTNGIATRVLGTTFSVRKYNDDKTARVIVAEGKVAFAGAIVSTGSIATASNDKDVQVLRDMALASMLDWASGRLTFNRTSLEDAIPDLRRWYKMEIKVASPELLTRRITASFQTENLQQVAQALATALGAHAEIRDNTVTFTSNH